MQSLVSNSTLGPMAPFTMNGPKDGIICPKISCPNISWLTLFKIGHDLFFPMCFEVFNVFAKVNHHIQNNIEVVQDCQTHYHILNLL